MQCSSSLLHADAPCELLCGTVDGSVALYAVEWLDSGTVPPELRLSRRWLCESEAGHSAVTALDTVAAGDLHIADAGPELLCALVGRDSGALDLYLLPPSASASPTASRGASAASSTKAPQLLGSIVRSLRSCFVCVHCTLMPDDYCSSDSTRT